VASSNKVPFKLTWTIVVGPAEWTYTEKPLWWTNERLPAEYVSALRNARTGD
jgi:hypothetical protein